VGSRQKSRRGCAYEETGYADAETTIIHQLSRQDNSFADSLAASLSKRGFAIAGLPCRQAAVRGRPRCRMHGCGRGAGGPDGERNGNYRHGRRRTNESKAIASSVRRVLREGRSLIKE